MADTPKSKLSGIFGFLRLNKSSFFRNKTDTDRNLASKGLANVSSAPSPTSIPQPKFSTISNPVPSSTSPTSSKPNPASDQPKTAQAGKAIVPGIPTRPADLKNKDITIAEGKAGDLAKLSASTAVNLKPKIKSSKISNPEAKSASPANFMGKSLDKQIDDLGDLAKLPAFRRTKPVNDPSKALLVNADNNGKFDTKLQKPHSLSMRYRIPTKLAKLFSDDPEKLKKLGNYIMEQVRLSDKDRAAFIGRLTGYRQIWRDFESAGLDPAFQGAHNVHVPMAYGKIKAMAARIYQAVMDIDPLFALKPRSKIAEVQKEDKEELLHWVTRDYSNMQQGWDSTIDQDIMNFVADGIAVTKQWWKRDIRKFVDVEETVRRPIELDEDGYPIIDEKEVEKEEVLYDCPMIEPVKLEDFWIVGKKQWDVDSADLIDHMQDYSKSDMIKMARLGFFQQDAVDAVIKDAPPAPPNQQTNLLSTELKVLDDFITGINKVGSVAGIKTYKIHECYLKYDIDDDGIDEELVVWIEERKRQVLRISYLERVGPGGKRPFTIKLFTPDGKGLGELLYGLNNEIDYIHNMRLDYGTLQNLPFFFYRAASGLNPIQLKVGPGMGIPVDDPNSDVMFPRLNGGTAYGFQEEQTVSSYSSDVSGITPFSMGQINQQGATRTATGTAALVNELNSNIDIHIKRYQRGFKRNLYILDLQCQDLLPLGTIIRVAGTDGKDIYKRFENRDSIRFATDFELTSNSINSNKAIERETAQMLVQQLANPIALQTGITNQDNLYNAFKNMLQKFEIKDIDAYITKPADISDSPYSAKDEINMIVVGVKPPLMIKDKHQEKLAFFDQFEKSPDFGWLTEGHIPLYLEVRRYHEQMAAAISAQAQNPMLQQGTQNLGLSGQLAAGAGAPQGQPAQQQSDLGQGGGQLRPQVGPPGPGSQ